MLFLFWLFGYSHICCCFHLDVLNNQTMPRDSGIGWSHGSTIAGGMLYVRGSDFNNEFRCDQGEYGSQVTTFIWGLRIWLLLDWGVAILLHLGIQHFKHIRLLFTYLHAINIVVGKTIIHNYSVNIYCICMFQAPKIFAWIYWTSRN